MASMDFSLGVNNYGFSISDHTEVIQVQYEK